MWFLPFLMAGALLFGGDDPLKAQKPTATVEQPRECGVIIDDGGPI